MSRGECELIVNNLRDAFYHRKSRDYDFRVRQLNGLINFLTDNESLIVEALAKDLHKSRLEAMAFEVLFTKNHIKNILLNLKQWMKVDKPPKDLTFITDGVEIYKDPYGVVLVMGAWNYPIQVTLCPVADAIAAGNCVVIKPSEVAPHTEKIMADLLPKYLDNNCCKVFCGGPERVTELLMQKFDYIFYTGSTSVGKIIYKAAAEHLTPVTLELGGKSPVFIDDFIQNIEFIVKRIFWGKFINAGQTCIAPDYILCSKKIEKLLLSKAEEVLKGFFGNDIKKSPDFARIINSRHFKRLAALLKGANIEIGGDLDEAELFIPPTILTNVRGDDPIMQEEIFGPILPIVNVADVREAVEFVNARPKPLALYVFSDQTVNVEYFLNNTSSGAVTINDVIVHASCDTLPFGGVGASGMGRYHGKYGFDTFTHNKGVLKRDLGWLTEKLNSLRYPPGTPSKISKISFFTAKRETPWHIILQIGRAHV